MVDRKVDRAGADGALDQRVAIGRGPRRRLGADVAAGTGTIFDDDRLAQGAPGALRDHARDQVGGPASGEWHDQVDRPRRISLFLAAGRNDNKQQRCGTEAARAPDVPELGS